MKHEPVRIEYIQVLDRLRKDLREDTVKSIMESMDRVGGLLHPIAIRYADGFVLDGEEADGVPVLVAGRHRLEAMRRWGETHIDCLIFESEKTASQWEISENLHRSDLTRQERADHELEWLKWESGEELPGHDVPTVMADGRRRGPQHEERGISLAARSLPIPGSSEAAKKKHLQRSVDIATKTTPAAKEAVKAAGLANSTTALLEVAKAPAEQQVAKVQEIAERRAAPRTKPRTQAPAPADDLVAEAMAIVRALPADQLERFLFELQNYTTLKMAPTTAPP